MKHEASEENGLERPAAEGDSPLSVAPPKRGVILSSAGHV